MGNEERTTTHREGATIISNGRYDLLWYQGRRDHRDEEGARVPRV